MKRLREAFDAEADQKPVSVIVELSDAVGPVAAGSGSGTAASGEAPPVDAGVDDVAPEPNWMKTMSGVTPRNRYYADISVSAKSA
jgi:hypothetical protein